MSHPERQWPPEATQIEARLREICAPLAEVVVNVDGFGHIVFQVAGKTFIFMGGGDSGVSLTVKTDKATQAQLALAGRYTVAHYIGRHGWVSHRPDDQTDWQELAERVTESYWRNAPRRLVKQMAQR